MALTAGLYSSKQENTTDFHEHLISAIGLKNVDIDKFRQSKSDESVMM